MDKDETLRAAAAMTAEMSMQFLQDYSISEERWMCTGRGSCAA